MDVQNVVAPPKQTYLVQKVTTLTNEDLSASPSKDAAKSQKAASLGEPVQEKESTHDHRENGTARSLLDTPADAGRSPTGSQSDELRDSPFKESNSADSHPTLKKSMGLFAFVDFYLDLLLLGLALISTVNFQTIFLQCLVVGVRYLCPSIILILGLLRLDV